MLHEKDAVRHELFDDIFASTDAGAGVPKYRLPEEEHDPRRVYQLLVEELMLDGNSRQNLATFCTTWAEDEVHKLMDLAMDKNMIDKDEYPQTAAIESRCVHMLADLWNSPEAANTVGTSTTGSSEAAMLCGMALLWKWRERQRAAGRPTDRPNLVTGPVQVCWHKFGRYWDVEIREIPMAPGRIAMNGEEAVARCDENTIGVAPTLGVTYTGEFEPVKEVAMALDALQEDSGLDVPVHVDGASGAFMAPFVYPDLEWDFRLPRVKSINASGHKFGLAPLGVGWAVWRDAEELPDDLVFHVNYLGGDMPTFALNFSRPGGQIVAQYYNFLRLGREGYRKIHELCRELAIYLGEEIPKLGPFDMLYAGDGGLPVVTWRIREGADPGYTLFDVADRLRNRGWQIPAYTLAPDLEDVPVQRILVRHGFTRPFADLVLSDMKAAIEHVERHPAARPLTAEESGGFSHGGKSRT